MSKIQVTFDKGIKINGHKTTPHHDGNNGRHVYIADGLVLKIDDRGYSHDDMGLWKSVKRADRKYFVPTLAQGVTDEGKRWSIQPYVELEMDFHVTPEANEIVERLYYRYGLTDIDFGDEEPRNWALHNGQPIIFDYGLGL